MQLSCYYREVIDRYRYRYRLFTLATRSGSDWMVTIRERERESSLHSPLFSCDMGLVVDGRDNLSCAQSLLPTAPQCVWCRAFPSRSFSEGSEGSVGSSRSSG